LLAWANRVARLQVTSHVAAAALGFAVVVAGPFAGRAVADVILDNLWPALAAVVLSAGLAVAAGRTEALGLARRGI
jgi:hypothetical protein